MGLKERKEIERITKDVLPDSTKALQEHAAPDATFDVQWESFQSSFLALQNLTQQLQSITDGIRYVAEDAAGRAVTQKIKSVGIVNVETTEEKKAVLDDGKLTLYANLANDITQGPWSWRNVQDWLLNNGGLKEQKEIERITKNVLPDFTKSLQEHAPGAQFEIEWPSFTYLALQALNQQLQDITDGIRYVANDDAGKEAIAERIKLVGIVHVDDTGKKKAVLDDETHKLTLYANLTDVTSGRWSWRDMETWLLNNL